MTPNDCLWYKDAVIYQLHVRAFRDGNADGVGDFRGLVTKLDYLQGLGVTAIWLLPFYPSPLRDDGYDISDYTSIHPAYGTLEDFRAFLHAAHVRGLRVITELVLNHTSDQHPWFQRARRAEPGTPEREFYVWSDTPDRYADARIIFKDFESANWTWDPVADAYYWHRFYTHQPDLNYDNPEVRGAIVRVLDFWLGMGVDGLRLDAVPYLIEREGTTCENLPETHEVLKALRRHVDQRYEDRMLLAEANQWPEDAVAYFGDGDECHMAFHFPVMPRIFMATLTEDRSPVIDIMSQTPDIPEVCQWALFLRNHDELTLEMVTDEERDHLYRVYADDPQARLNLGIRRRLAPLLENNRRMIEMLNGLLFSLPGTPVVYYGDEIGMGDNIYLGDRNGVRTPMQWSSDRNAGFSRAGPQQLYLPVIIDPEYHAEAVNVEAQERNPNSLLRWTRRLIALRKRYRALARGSLRFLEPRNRKVLAFLREHGDERVLVVANLSRFAQYMELDLSAFEGAIPVEVFGGTEFPPIGELPYLLTLGPHGFYWFSLQAATTEDPSHAGRWERLPVLDVSGAWPAVFAKRNLGPLEEALPGYLRERRWFGGRARRIKSVEVSECIPVTDSVLADATLGSLVLAGVEYADGGPESYVLALTAAPPERGGRELDRLVPLSVARLRTGEGERLLHDASCEPEFLRALLAAIVKGRRLRGSAGAIVPLRTSALPEADGSLGLDPRVIEREQTNTSVAYGDRFILKLLRRPDEGVNPELEIGRFLTERAAFPHVPPVAGALQYQRPRRPPLTLGILQALVPNDGDAWQYTLSALEGFVESVRGRPSDKLTDGPAGAAAWLAREEPPRTARETIGPFLDSARLLGRRTGELHQALACDRDDPAFAPEPLTSFHRRSLYQSLRALTSRVLASLRERAVDLPDLAVIVDREHEILASFDRIQDVRVSGALIRVHGDLHLGQVLRTGGDFVFIDFEGEPARPLGERRLKRSPLRDAAAMLRSFRYATARTAAGIVGAPSVPRSLGPWLRLWERWVSAAYLGAYLDVLEGTALLPPEPKELEVLLDALMMEKALYEAAYEVNHRPDWIAAPVRGILDLLDAAG